MFDEQNYGCRTFGEFLARLPHLVTVERRDGADLAVTVTDEPPAALGS